MDMIDFDSLIDNFLEREFKAKAIGKYYPSEVGGCLRRTWFSYKFPKKIDGSLARIFHAGNMLHDFIADVLKSAKKEEVELLEREIPIKIEKKEFVISGRIDNIVLAKLDGKKYLVEVKSTKYLPEEPSEDHVMQLQIYMHAKDIHKRILVYIQKDNLQTKNFNINYEKEIIERIFERFRLLHDFLIRNEIPEAEAKQDETKKWLCKNCLYQEECEDQENFQCTTS